MGWLDFDPEHPLARAFAEVPPAVWRSRMVEGRTALGWVTQAGSYLPSPRQYDWVQHLLSCGADPDSVMIKPFSRRTRYFHDPSFRVWAFRSATPMVEKALAAGMPLTPSFGATQPWLHDVLRHRRVDWLLAWFQNRHNLDWDRDGIIGKMLADWWQHPDLAAAAVVALREAGASWGRDGCIHLWSLALMYPDGPWLAWAQASWDEAVPATLEVGCDEWRRIITETVVLKNGRPSRALLNALEKRLPPEHRSVWAPALPSWIWPATPQDSISTLSKSPKLTQWAALEAAIGWACAWGLSPKARTENGLPYASWVFRCAWQTADQAFGETDALERAWSCLQALVMHGCSTRLRCRASQSKIDAAFSSASVHTKLNRRTDGWSPLPWGLKEWPDRYVLLQRACTLAHRLPPVTVPSRLGARPPRI